MDVRTLRIKTGVLSRTSKELAGYGQELTKQQAHVEKLIANGVDIHDVNKQKEVLGETEIMIPDCKKRLHAAYHDLTDAVATFEQANPAAAAAAAGEEGSIVELTNARALLKEVTLP